MERTASVPTAAALRGIFAAAALAAASLSFIAAIQPAPVAADERRNDNRGRNDDEKRGYNRHDWRQSEWDSRDYRGWGGGYYRAPPPVYVRPYYPPPPVDYGPGFGFYFRP